MITALLNEEQRERKRQHDRKRYWKLSPEERKAYIQHQCQLHRRRKEKKLLRKSTPNATPRYRKRTPQELGIDAKIAELKSKPIEDLIYVKKTQYNERSYR